MSMDEPIKAGDKVRKRKGYTFRGFAVAVYTDLYGVEHADVQIPGEKGVDHCAGMIHLFPTKDLEHDRPLEGRDDPGG